MRLQRQEHDQMGEHCGLRGIELTRDGNNMRTHWVPIGRINMTGSCLGFDNCFTLKLNTQVRLLRNRGLHQTNGCWVS